MRDLIVSPRRTQRALDLDWATSGIREGAYELSTGRRQSNAKYTKSPWANAAMQIRGLELARLPWRLVRNDTEVTSHPIIDLLNSWGKESNYFEAVIATEIDQLMYGAGYWLIDGNELKRIAAVTMAVKATPQGITGFEQTIDGRIVNRWRRDEMVYFREHDPDNDLLPGPAAVDVAKYAIDQEYQANLYVSAYFANDATPALLLHTEQSLGKQGVEETVNWWNKLFRGTRKKGKVGVVDRGLEAQLLSAEMGKQALVEIRDQARQDICVSFRVPKILVGSILESTYANAAESRKFLMEDVILPRAEYYANVINEDLVHRLDPNVDFEFATDELPILSEDASVKWARLQGALIQKVISPEFARQEMGWPEDAAPEEVDAPLAPEQDEMRMWRRKAMKALKAGKSPAVPFESAELSASLQAGIRAQLATAKSVEDVAAVFNGARTWRK